MIYILLLVAVVAHCDSNTHRLQELSAIPERIKQSFEDSFPLHTTSCTEIDLEFAINSTLTKVLWRVNQSYLGSDPSTKQTVAAVLSERSN